MESAIPAHLQCPRTRLRRVPDDYEPPYPSFVARHAPAVQRVVMAYFGVQSPAPRAPAAEAALAALQQRFAADAGPRHWDRARYTDEAGHDNVFCAAYWDEPAHFDAWFAAQGRDWTRTARDGLGSFTEVLRPDVRRYETLFSAHDRPEGIAALATHMSGMVMEHAYWGGARDSIPASQSDAMEPGGELRVERDGARVGITGHSALCLIRSGQDWSDTDGDERRMYRQDVEPLLREGLDFLRDRGLEVGCFANRYVTVEDAAGRPQEKS
jgi:aldoxime dehydratase